MNDQPFTPAAAQVRAEEQRGYDRLVNELRRIRTPRAYTLDALARKLTPVMGHDYHRAACGPAPTGYPVPEAGRLLLALHILPRLVADGVFVALREGDKLVYRFTGRVPERPARPADEEDVWMNGAGWAVSPTPDPPAG